MTGTNQTDRFGFLHKRISFSFDGGSVATSEDFIAARKWVNSQTNRDGYLYPSISYTVKKDMRSGKWSRIPKTNRPARFFRMPPSHNITLTDPKDQSSNRYGLAGFVVQSLAFLYGTKLQFWDWFIEGRVPTKTQTINVALAPSDVHTFFQRAVPRWLGFDDTNKKRMINLLFVHSTAGAVEWDWQRFQLEYMVTDACYAIANQLFKCRAKHEERLNALSDTFGVPRDATLFKLFIRLRNNLFHETLWDGGQIFTSPSTESFYAPLHLRRFNHRVITAMLCGQGRYTRTKWTSIGTYAYFLD
jgi:hypothetical protein